jgi:flagellar capping protein FliD
LFIIIANLVSDVSEKVKKVTTDITDQIGNYDEQLSRLGERMEDKHKNLQIKFAKLDSTMGRLRSQQNYVSQQLSALSNSPKGGGKDK